MQRKLEWRNKDWSSTADCKRWLKINTYACSTGLYLICYKKLNYYIALNGTSINWKTYTALHAQTIIMLLCCNCSTISVIHANLQLVEVLELKFLDIWKLIRSFGPRSLPCDSVLLNCAFSPKFTVINFESFKGCLFEFVWKPKAGSGNSCPYWNYTNEEFSRLICFVTAGVRRKWWDDGVSKIQRLRLHRNRDLKSLSSPFSSFGLSTALRSTLISLPLKVYQVQTCQLLL